MCLTGKKLILFDLDGVLLDSKINMKLSWNEVCKEHNLDIAFEDYFSKIGRPFKDILDILGVKEKQSNIEKTFNDASTRLLNKVSFYDGVGFVLNKLSDRDIKTGIVTSKNTIKTQKILELIDFAFDIVQTPNNYLQGKPAPDHILYAISELNMDAADTLYIGDMDVDYETAKRAKVDYAHALWGYGICHDENIIKLKQISHLIDII
jgi:HAD superfamily hydrolase (TIGR01549 family)